ncbi:50S ribosomal protein L17 [Patescibacteria group bacterium]
MNHNKKGKTLDRCKEEREMLLRNLVTQMVLREKIKTTKAKAKAMKPIIEKIITKGKTDNLDCYRKIVEYVTIKKAAGKIVKELSPKYKERKGGYTRIIKLGNRKGDGAEMAQIEFV